MSNHHISNRLNHHPTSCLNPNLILNVIDNDRTILEAVSEIAANIFGQNDVTLIIRPRFLTHNLRENQAGRKISERMFLNVPSLVQASRKF